MARTRLRIEHTSKSQATSCGEIAFDLRRSSARRTLAVSIDDRARVRVYAPFTLADEVIQQFLDQRAGWILEKRKKALRHQELIRKKTFDAGQEFLFLGKKHALTVQESASPGVRLTFDGHQWITYVPQHLLPDQRSEIIKTRLIQWYKSQAAEVLGARVFQYTRLVGVGPKHVCIRGQKRLWGSCDFHKQSINLNWQIILSPLAVIDYVIVHELCHLLVPNHSQRFWKKVEKFMPDYKVQKRWLKEHYTDMVLP